MLIIQQQMRTAEKNQRPKQHPVQWYKFLAWKESRQTKHRN